MVHKGLPWWFSHKESVCNVGATRNMSLSKLWELVMDREAGSLQSMGS